MPQRPIAQTAPRELRKEGFVILGFEEGHVPSFFVKGLPDEDPQVREELALLHVMSSRAKEELILTVCHTTNGYPQKPSRWLKLIEPHLERAR